MRYSSRPTFAGSTRVVRFQVSVSVQLLILKHSYGVAGVRASASGSPDMPQRAPAFKFSYMTARILVLAA
eukprot:883707-Rhodomonas_salina.2